MLVEERIFVLSIRCLGGAENLSLEVKIIFFYCCTINGVQRRNLKMDKVKILHSSPS